MNCVLTFSRAAESHGLDGLVLRPRFMTPINSLFHFKIFQSILIDFLFLNIFMQSMMQRKQIYDRNVFKYILEVGNEIQAEIVLTLSPQAKNENLQP